MLGKARSQGDKKARTLWILGKQEEPDRRIKREPEVKQEPDISPKESGVADQDEVVINRERPARRRLPEPGDEVVVLDG